jgi:hypothetical protein
LTRDKNDCDPVIWPTALISLVSVWLLVAAAAVLTGMSAIADLVGLPVERADVKAARGEGMGFVHRKEGARR